MSQTLHPTPYADVNTILRDFQTHLQAILGNQMVGMYLYGSLALGDFDADHSDIDFIVVTAGELTEDHFNALAEMHARFDNSGSRWAGKIEAAYIAKDALNLSQPTAAQYPQIEKGTALFRAPLEIGWVFQRYSLREHGIGLTGPDPRTLMTPIDPNDIRQAIIVIVGGWFEQARHDPEWLAWVRQHDAQSFVVLTLCRCLYALDTGKVVSKPAAAHWAQNTLGERWSGLIERSLMGLHEQGQASDGDIADTIALIQYTFEHIQ